MRSSRVARITTVLIIVAVLILAGLNNLSVEAGSLAAGTAAATMAATQAGGGSGTANSTGIIFEPCPHASANSAATMAATESSSASAVATAAPIPTIAASSSTERPYLGLEVETVDNCGLAILGIRPDGPASKTQLRVGDIIVAVDCLSLEDLTYQSAAEAGNAQATMVVTKSAAANSLTVTQGGCENGTASTMAATMSATMGAATEAASAPNDNGLALRDAFVNYLNAHHPGDTIVLTVERGDKQWNIPVTLGTFPTS